MHNPSTLQTGYLFVKICHRRQINVIPVNGQRVCNSIYLSEAMDWRNKSVYGRQAEDPILRQLYALKDKINQDFDNSYFPSQEEEQRRWQLLADIDKQIQARLAELQR